MRICTETICILASEQSASRRGRKTPASSWLASILCPIGLLWTANVSAEGADIEKLMHRNKLSEVIIADRDVQLFSEPDTSKVSRRATWQHHAVLDPKRFAVAPPGWIPLKGEDTSNPERAKKFPDSWVQSKDVVIDSDFKMVIGCWPIKYLSLTLGDYSAEVLFTISGQAVAVLNGDYTKPVPAQLFMARSIFQVRPLKGRFQYFVDGSLDTAEKTIFQLETPIEEQVRFSDKELKRCSGVQLKK